MSTNEPQRLDLEIQQHSLASPRVLLWGQHLVTAILLVIAMLRQVSTPEHLWAAVLVSVLFACWYAMGFIPLTNNKIINRPAWWLAILLTIWIVSLFVSAEFMWLAFSLWLLLGHQLPFVPSILWSVVVYAFTLIAPFLHHGELSVAAAAGPLVGGLFAWGISRGYLQMERDAQERTSLVNSLMRAQEETSALQEELARSQHEAGIAAERTRLAREIHDTIAQQLSSIGLHAKAASAASNLDAANEALERIDHLSGQSLTDLRRIIAALAPAELDSQALAGALSRILDDFATDSGVKSRVDIEPGLPLLDPSLQIALLRTAQSALSNVRRHAQATTVVLSLSYSDDEVRLDIVDDGRGFTPPTGKLQHNTPVGGFGLTAMNRRLNELGGGLDVESAIGEGTALCAHLPLHFAKDNS
ncbi:MULTISPECIES: sensor histidine kinase [Micrococcaceae]|uniref:sensor histidine kinase n=1 Tax=Micrococcaceae TaxID=1268 RepID=UPI00103621DF|nr:MULTISPECIES: sensor histidine kinase [Micrococcaceae]TAP27454.1 sensor histidine kinase [Arthrobacter sp. S41]UXN30879.1 sensor histidine kinase [Glutamicibacter sp. M10]